MNLFKKREISEKYNLIKNNMDKVKGKYFLPELEKTKDILLENLKILNEISEKDFNKYAKAKDRYKDILGTYSDDKDLYNKIIKNINDRIKYCEKEINRQKEFDNAILELPKHEIVISNNKIKKQSLDTMKDIKTIKVGKNFNFNNVIKYVVISIATTGLKVYNDEIISISAIKYIDGEPIDSFNTHIKTSIKRTEENIKYTEITETMLENAPSFDDIGDDFYNFVKGYNIVGYNISFVLKFLYRNGIILNEQKDIKIFDVLELTKKAFDDLSDYSFDRIFTNYIHLVRKEKSTLNNCYAINLVFKLMIDLITKEK